MSVELEHGRMTLVEHLTELRTRMSARYVAVVVDGWQPGSADLAEFAVLG